MRDCQTNQREVGRLPERHEGHVANSDAHRCLHLGVEGARHGVSGGVLVDNKRWQWLTLAGATGSLSSGADPGLQKGGHKLAHVVQC